MSTPHDTPLWLQIRNHPSLFCLHPTPQQIATIFRVIADVVAPEEPKPHVFDDSYTHGARDARLEIRALLLAEAERAEVAQ
jgi:hypothetical protein